MSVMTRVETLDLAGLLDETLSPKARSKILAETAEEVLKEAQEINRQAIGRVPKHKTLVDGRASTALHSVKPEGTIAFEFELLDDAISWIAEQLVKHSPRRRGRYAASHELYADGVKADPQRPPVAKTYVFVNTRPYAGRLERKASAGIYEAVAVLANRRFSKAATVQFGYRSEETGRSTPAIVLTAR